VRKVTSRILSRNNVKNLIHIVQNSVVLCTAVVCVIAPNKMLDLRECFFYQVEVRRIGRQVFKANAEAVNELEDLVVMVNLCVIEN
jgi:pyruvate formate-lyase activating enzyme-like uncharacterized protein